jgi:dephospho-CoA kinase
VVDQRVSPGTLTLALTGGIGCGKSSVSDRLAERGSVVIDADLVAREVVEPGAPAYGPLLERFGLSIIGADGTIDRGALAQVVFSDPSALADLNAITHPVIGEVMAQRKDKLIGTAEFIVLAIPLLRPAHREQPGFDVVVSVECPPEVAAERLVNGRGMDRADALARIEAQRVRTDRLDEHDFVVDNSSTVGHLEEEVGRLWRWIAREREARLA